MSDNQTEAMDLITQRLDAKRRLGELTTARKQVADLIKGIDRQLDEIAEDEESGQARLPMAEDK